MQRPISSTIYHPVDRSCSVHAKWEVDNVSIDRIRLIDLIDEMCAGYDVFFRFVRAVKDIMPSSVKTLTLDDTVGKALELMKQSDIRHVCVVDIPIGEEKKPFFVGVVSERDILRQITPDTKKVDRATANLKVKRQLLGQVVTRKPKTVSPETSIPDMLSIMLDNHVDMVPVLSGDDLMSVVTTSDIMKLIIRFDTIYQMSRASPRLHSGRACPRFEEGTLSTQIQAPDKNLPPDRLSGSADNKTSLLATVMQPVTETMTEEVVCLGIDVNLAAAIDAMKNGQFRHIPIVDKNGRLVGILSDRDVLRYLPFVGGQRLPGTGEFRSSLFHVDIRDPSLRLPVTSIMTRNVTHVQPDCVFYDAVKMLHELKISCLPVVDKEKKLLGIITVTDVMRALLGAYKLTGKSDA
jgi:CBS domain-containing protein